MAYRTFLNLLFRRFGPIQPVIYATSIPMFTNPDPPKDPTKDQKLQFETPNASSLSYDYLIKQSTVNAVNSASQAITVTYIAIETTSKDYRDLLTKLIALMNEATINEVADSHWDEVLEIRSQMQVKKQMLMRFFGYMDYVHKMAEAASEISFLAGMDSLSTSLTIRIDDALVKVQNEKTSNSLLELEYVRVQEETIKSSNKENGDTNKKKKNSSTKDIKIIDLDDLDEELKEV